MKTQRCNFTSAGKCCEEGIFVGEASKCEMCEEEMCESHIRGMITKDYDDWTCTDCIANFVTNEPTKHIHVYPMDSAIFCCTPVEGES